MTRLEIISRSFSRRWVSIRVVVAMQQPLFIVPVARASTSQSSRASTSKKKPVSSLSVGDLLIGVVSSVGGAQSAWLDVGVATVTGKNVNARLRLKGNTPPPTVGAAVPVIVRRLNIPAARVEVQRPANTTELPLTRRLEELDIGEQLSGVIIALIPTGAIIDVGVCRAARLGVRTRCMALLRRPHFKADWASPQDKSRRDDIQRMLSVGEKLDVFVRVPDPSSGRLFLDSRQITPEFLALERTALVNEGKRKKKKRRRNPVSEDDVGSERKGTVVTIMKYGFFVDIGAKRDALVHYENMGTLRTKWQDLVQADMEVGARIIKVVGDRVNLELLSVAGISAGEEEEAINIALERPEPRNIEVVANNTTSEEGEDRDDVSAEDTDDDDDSYGDGDTFDSKFTDDYLEDKYDY